MADKKGDNREATPVLKDVAPGRDAVETPVAKPARTPLDPNAKPQKG